MLTHILTIIPLVIAMGLATPAWSYDAAMAESYAKLFAPITGAEAGKALHLMSPGVFVEKIKAKESVVTLDVRTPAEITFLTSILPGSLMIPINQLFTEASLARIPTDKPVVVLCKSGARATAAGTALRHIGFENVYVLKGGIKALITYMGPGEANAPLKGEAIKK